MACMAFGWMAGCASNRARPLPPGGLLNEMTTGGLVAHKTTPAIPEEVAARKAIEKTIPKETARAAADAKKNAAAEEKQRLFAEKQAAADAKRLATEQKATEKKTRKEAALAAAEAKKTAEVEEKQQRLVEKQAVANAKRLAAEQKAAEQKIQEKKALAAAEAKQASAEATKIAAAEEKRRHLAEKQAAAKKAAAEKAVAASKDESAKDAEPNEVSEAFSEYVLQVGDEIDIQVYREPELSGTFKINPSGEIRHSLVGSISMANQTVEEAEAVFTKKLAKDYLVNPRVIFKLLSTQSSQIVVLGEVAKPGVYPLPLGGSLTLLQAIAGAGGFTELASPDRIRIVRKLPGGGATTLRVRVSELMRGKNGLTDVPLEPDDVIQVDQIFF